jgi:hypothetical protein
VPHPPKAFETVVVADASAEVVDDFDAAHHRPQPADPPNQQELEPDENQVEKSEHLSFNERVLRRY